MTTITFRTSDLPISIEAVERKYNATFVGDFCIKDRNGDYIADTAAIFWQDKPPVEGYSHYMALLFRNNQLYIASGASAFDQPIIGVKARDGEFIYSRHRHDFRTSSDGSVSIDGGRDYLRLVGSYIPTNQYELSVNGPILTLIRHIPERFELTIPNRNIPKNTENNFTNKEVISVQFEDSMLNQWTDGPKVVIDTTSVLGIAVPPTVDWIPSSDDIDALGTLINIYSMYTTIYIFAPKSTVQLLADRFPHRDIRHIYM